MSKRKRQDLQRKDKRDKKDKMDISDSGEYSSEYSDSESESYGLDDWDFDNFEEQFIEHYQDSWYSTHNGNDVQVYWFTELKDGTYHAIMWVSKSTNLKEPGWFNIVSWTPEVLSEYLQKKGININSSDFDSETFFDTHHHHLLGLTFERTSLRVE